MNVNAFSSAVLTFLLSCFTFACSSKIHHVVPVAEATSGEYVYYNLPQTVIVVTATGTITETKSTAPNCTDAVDLEHFGLSVPNYVGRLLTIANIKLSKKAEPDPAQKYAVELEDKGTNVLTLHINDSGVPSKAGSEATATGLSIAKSFLKLAATTLIGSSLSPAGHCADVRKQLDDIRTRLLNLHSSVGAADNKEILKLKEAQLKLKEKKLEAEYTGVNIYPPKTIVCEIVPTSGATVNLLSWSLKQGIISTATACDVPSELKKNIGGASVRTGKTYDKLVTKHELILHVDPVVGGLASITIPTTGRAAERSFYYRIPKRALVWVEDTITTNPNQVLGMSPPTTTTNVAASKRENWNIAQLGIVSSIPRLSTRGSAKVDVTFDPDTGSLKEIGLIQTTGDAAAVIDVVTGQLSAYYTTKKAEVEVDVELTTLQRQQAILEAMVAIEAAEATLRDD